MSRKLNELLHGISYQPIGNTDKLQANIEEIIFDSRKAASNRAFVAIEGAMADGHQYISGAVQAGVDIVICERVVDQARGVLYLIVEDSQLALGLLAANFYEHPSKELKVVGVTGTNGKTTTVTLLYRLFKGLGQKTGLLSTVDNRVDNQVLPATHTTPDPVSINALLAKMRDAGCDYVFMEVSSHAVDQQRIAGIQFDGAVFTNITHEHLDYHKTFQNYITAKKKFFDLLPKNAFALINVDDKRGRIMVQNTLASVHSYALKKMADFKARILENSFTGLLLKIGEKEVHTRLVGDFNAYNLLAVYAVAVLLEEQSSPAGFLSDQDWGLEVLRVLSQLKSAEGRFDHLHDHRSGITAIVDFAHSPDALEKVLQTLEKVRTGNERIITVVGCGGDRDTEKRPIMAKVACQGSHQVILTSDNPRTEDPNAILADMQKGVPANAQATTLVIADRLQAIRTACQLANEGDIVLIAGKGHEKYQEIKGLKHPFDDKRIVTETLNQLNQKEEY